MEPRRQSRQGERERLFREFERAQRRGLETVVAMARVETYKPGLDDGRNRVFDTMDDYRRWCNEALPEWLGYRTRS